MRILQIHTRYRIRAGEDTVVDEEAAALARAGHEIERVIFENPSETPSATLALARSLRNRSAIDRVRRAIDDARPEVIHVHNTWFAASSAVVAVAAESGAPVVMTVHNYRLACLSADLYRDGQVCTACVGRSPLAGVFHGCYRGSRTLSAIHAIELMSTRHRRTLLDGVDRFILPSAFMAGPLRDVGVPAERIVVKPHFLADTGPRIIAPSDSHEVLAVGRLAPGKGIETLLSAWSRRRTPVATQLTVIGDGPQRAALDSARPPGCDLLGWREHDDVGERMRRARALVMPTEWYEPFGMVLIEAMRAGLPIITTSIAAGPAIVGGRRDLVVGPSDPGALASALDRLDDETVDTEGAANRRRFLDHYEEERGVAGLIKLYEDTLGSRR